nr:hypothetical protein [Eubacterium sp.]
MKKSSSIIITLLLAMIIIFSAGTGAEAKTEKVKAPKVTCTSAGKINVSFKADVVYDKEVSAVVTDADGKEFASKII